MRSKIVGLGIFLPEHIRTNEAWPPDFGERTASRVGAELTQVRAAAGEDACDAIVARHLATEAGDRFLGSLRRHVADPEMSAAEAEAIAGQRALEDAGIHPHEIDLVLSWAMVPDRITPPTAPRVAHLVGAERAAGIGLDVACATALAQLTLGSAMIESGRAARVLLTQSHLIARANPMGHPTSPLVGDAASAMVLEASEKPGVGVFHMVSHGEYHEAVTWARCRDEIEEPAWWKSGTEYTPGTRNRAQAKMLSSKLVHLARDTIGELLERTRRSIDSIDILACTQPRKWFPAAVAEAVGLPVEKAPDTFDDVAHIGGCGVVFNLFEAKKRQMLTPGSSVLLYGMGAGITRAAGLIEW